MDGIIPLKVTLFIHFIGGAQQAAEKHFAALALYQGTRLRVP